MPLWKQFLVRSARDMLYCHQDQLGNTIGTVYGAVRMTREVGMQEREQAVNRLLAASRITSEAGSSESS